MSCRVLLLLTLLTSACGLEPVSAHYGDGGTLFPLPDAGWLPDVPDGGDLPPVCAVPWKGDLQLNSGLDDEATDLWIDPDGTLFVTGYQRGLTGVTNIEPSGDAQGVVLRLSPAGDVEQTTVFDTGGTDVVESITRDAPTGRLFVAGRTSGTFPGQSNAGQFDTFVATLDQAGNVEHLMQTGTDGPQHPRRIQTAPGGRLFVGGYDDVFVPTNYVERWEDPFVLSASFDEGRRDDVLMPIWSMPFATPGTDFGNDLAADASGVYVAGMTGAGSKKGPFLRKLGHDGSPIWWKGIHGATGDSMNAVLVAPDGRLFAAGSSFVQLGERSYGQQDAFVLELHPETGELVRSMQFGGAGSEWVTSMATDADGNLYVGGVSIMESLRPGRPFAGESDTFVIRFSADGRVTGLWEWGTEREDWLTAVRVDACGRVFAVGYTDTGSAARRDMFVRQVLLEPYDPETEEASSRATSAR